jgi:putative transposase
VRYAVIREHEGQFPVAMMCRLLHVSRSGYYDWRGREVSARAGANARLLECIRRIYARSRENYGSRKIWRALLAAGESCGRHRVNRNFSVQRADRVWAGDMTFVATREGWLYLAVLIDLYSRRVVGWAMGSKMNQALANDAIMMAIGHRQPSAGLIHHTDRGILYATASYQAILNHHGMIQSHSRKGDCYDNAVVESFFANLKNELTWHQRFNTRDEAKTAIFDYIEVFYNRQRLHETLDYVTPVRYEEQRVA